MTSVLITGPSGHIVQIDTDGDVRAVTRLAKKLWDETQEPDKGGPPFGFQGEELIHVKVGIEDEPPADP